MVKKKPENTLDERRKSLESKLDSSNRLRAESAPGVDGQKRSAAFGRALRLSSEFIVAILVGAGIGWGIDEVLGTRPWGMIIMLILGFCAGVLNVMRSAGLVAENRALGRGQRQAEKEKNGNATNDDEG